jgi:hypothetical protein
MRLYSVCLSHAGKFIRFGKISGALYESVSSVASSDWRVAVYPSKIARALELCHHPYRLEPCAEAEHRIPDETEPSNPDPTAIRLVRFCRTNFLLGRISASLRTPKFETALQAIRHFRGCIKENQDSLCLARALYAAKTSRRFAEGGVVFIGVFLPARSMHAWVFEDGRMADPDDHIWINYRPVAVFG